MPQKKNPDVAELGRGKTGRVYGALFALLTLLKGLPLAYNKDLQEDKEPLFDVVKTLRQTLAIYTPLLASLKINEEKMQLAVEEGYLNATALAEHLVKNGVTFRSAHSIVGKMVIYCINKKCRLEDLSLPEMQQFAPSLTEKVYQALDVKNAVAACQMNNESKESLLDTELVGFEHQLQLNQAWVSGKNEMLASVYARFDLPLTPPHSISLP
jgi:argininosuccinate lyase